MDWLKKIVTKKDKQSAANEEEKENANHESLSSLEESVDYLNSVFAAHENPPYIPEEAAEEPVLQSEKDPNQPNKPPVNASVEIKISPDKMSATVILRAPENGGSDITAEDVYAELAAQDIVYGHVKAMINLKVKGRKYDEPFVAAVGLTPKDGENGQIIELVERVKEISFTENAYGNVDYKALNLINQIEEGTVLCEIVPPTNPVPGINIFGTEIYGKPGTTPTIPQGDNTILSDNGTKLVAAKSGNLVYRNNRFAVQVVLEIPEDVDTSTGNINFSGDVLVKGSVFEGFEIKAGGNVTVYGIVEGVYISAGGSIQLKQGINGMGRGIIEAKGDITCRYLENCTARAGGSIQAETIIHSNVFSGASINVTGSRSSIIGGVCSALQTIEVKTIGSRMNTLTTIMLGATTEMIEERRNLSIEIGAMEKRLYEMALDVRFIEQRISAGNLTDKHRALLQKLQKEYPELTARLGEYKKRAEELEEVIANNLNCRLTCQHIFPPTRINIGTETVHIMEDRNRCVIFYSDGEIKFSYN